MTGEQIINGYCPSSQQGQKPREPWSPLPQEEQVKMCFPHDFSAVHLF
jgi:hypothetical protein